MNDQRLGIGRTIVIMMLTREYITSVYAGNTRLRSTKVLALERAGGAAPDLILQGEV